MGSVKIRRFTVPQRLFHFLLVVSFMLQATTGLSRMFFETAWGRGLASVFGGYEGALAVHKASGTFMVLLFLAHLVYLAVVIDWRRYQDSVFGPDSLMPRASDFTDFFRHVGWFLGLAEEPRFRRWGYWEKLGYWAVFWGVALFGITGFMLFDPVVTGRFLPGWILNIALYLHREETVLAIGYLFIAHFFVAHFRPRSFPMDRAIFDGTLDLDETRAERVEWIRRLEREGRLEREIVAPRVSSTYRGVTFAFGYAVVVLGLFLIIFGLLNGRYVTW